MNYTPDDGYSAPVQLELHLEKEVIGLAKVGPDRIMLNQPRSVPIGAAVLVVRIGEWVRRSEIILDRCNAVDRIVHYF